MSKKPVAAAMKAHPWDGLVATAPKDEGLAWSKHRVPTTQKQRDAKKYLLMQAKALSLSKQVRELDNSLIEEIRKDCKAARDAGKEPEYTLRLLEDTYCNRLGMNFEHHFASFAHKVYTLFTQVRGIKASVPELLKEHNVEPTENPNESK